MPAAQNKKLQPWRRGLPGLGSYGVVYGCRGRPGRDGTGSVHVLPVRNYFKRLSRVLRKDFSSAMLPSTRSPLQITYTAGTDEML